MVEPQNAFLIHLEYIRKAVDEINDRLDALNDRTRKLEATSAVHAWAIGIVGAGSLALFVWALAKI